MNCLLHKVLCLCLLGFMYVVSLGGVAEAGITNFYKLIVADYWQLNNPSGDSIVLDGAGVAAFNKKIAAASPSVVDLAAYAATVSGDSVREMITDYSVLEDELYLHGKMVSDNYKNILRTQCNVAAVPADVGVQYAVTVRRTNLRNLPTGEALFYYPGDEDFDALQETALDPAEPLAVLHFSANGFFYYVQAANYSGWISKYDIAFTDRDTWLHYVEPKKFLVVTGKNVLVKTNGEMVEYQQGARIALTGEQGNVYIASVPVRSADGRLGSLNVSLLKSDPALHCGYLAYTANNIMAAVFKFYDAPYGWGGLKSSVDCSSLIYNAYRTVGIFLPRNADEQESSAGVHHKLQGLDEAGRSAVISALQPGACLYMDGHVVMYLGRSADIPYVIHALGSYYNAGEREIQMKVVVSDLKLGRAGGISFLNSLTTAVEFK